MSLNPLAFQTGDKCLVKIGTITLPADEWSLSIKGMNRAVSNGRDGRKRIPGLLDADGDLKMPYDTGNDPTTTAAGGLTVGAIVVLKLFVDTTHFYQLSAIVDDIGPGAVFDGELKFPVKFSLESGTVVYPVYP